MGNTRFVDNHLTSNDLFSNLTVPLQEARGILEHLMEVIPDEVNVPFMLAQVYTHLGQPTQSNKHMAIAQDIEPKIANVIRMVQQRGLSLRPILDASGPTAAHPDNSIEMEGG